MTTTENPPTPIPDPVTVRNVEGQVTVTARDIDAESPWPGRSGAFIDIVTENGVMVLVQLHPERARQIADALYAATGFGKTFTPEVNPVTARRLPNPAAHLAPRAVRDQPQA